MKKHLRLTPILLLAAFVAGCQGPCDSIDSITGPQLTSGTADFTRYVAAGTSISAIVIASSSEVKRCRRVAGDLVIGSSRPGLGVIGSSNRG